MKRRSSEDLGVLTALIERFENERLPRALKLREHLNEGNKLRDGDIQFLETIHHDISQIEGLIKRNPDFESLATKATNLVKELAQMGLDNEGNS